MQIIVLHDGNHLTYSYKTPVSLQNKCSEGVDCLTVIGVVKDFHASSLHHVQEPMFIVKGHWGRGYQQIRLTGLDLQNTVDFKKKVWAKYDADHPFEYFFLDQRFNDQYKEELIQSELLNLLSYICIFISLLGLVGLSAFNASQRIKEMSMYQLWGE